MEKYRPGTEMPNLKDDRPVGWRRTKLLVERINVSPLYTPPDKDAPYGRFANRPVIGSGMPHILGGVYLGANAREAIVVETLAKRTSS